MNNPCLVAYSRKQIQVGSKSFCFASLFFSPRERAGAWLLYSWCRFCDDEIDQAVDAKDALLRLERLESQTRDAFTSVDVMASPQFEGLRLILRDFRIPLKYPLDLLRGMRMDVEARIYETEQDLEEYCYCVAGVVGLMMCHIMGVSSSKALPHAVALGSAMQLTNISRDVADDLSLGRIYFPRRWLRSLGLSDTEYANCATRESWAQLSERLLELAARRYREGRQGLIYLSFRAALACGIAASVYERIGHKVSKKGNQAWHDRCYVSLGEKIWLALREAVSLSLRMSKRILIRWSPQPIERIWGES